MQPAEEKILYACEVATSTHGPVWIVTYHPEAAMVQVESWFAEIKGWGAEVVTGVRQLAPATKKRLTMEFLGWRRAQLKGLNGNLKVSLTF